MNPRRLLAFLHDLVASALAWMLAYLLRFNFEIPPDFLAAMTANVGIVVVIQAVIFYGFGLYRGVWRFASLPDLRRIVMAAGTCALATPTVLALSALLQGVPRSVYILDPILLMLILAGSRIAYRSWKEGNFVSLRALDGKYVLILGGGDAAEMLLRTLSTNREWRAVGLLDDSIRRHGALIQGVPVLGALDSLAKHAAHFGVKHAIVAMPSALPSERRRAVQLATSAGLSVLTVPAMADLVSGKVSVSEVRRVDVEDLLGREQVQLDDAGIRSYLSGKTAMVTGAGGSIGSELCRQIARYAPQSLIFFEASEFSLYRMEQEFRANHPDLAIVCIAGDVRDAERIASVIGKHAPDVIFHAAAYKHVPLMEEHNAWEAVRNNVLGTLTVAEAAARAEVSKFVMVSTDKAVNPVNVMGATKRLAEMVCQSLQQSAKTRFVMVRFGNVLGSAGSVIPKFREQIAAGGPVTVTHPDIQRYFMSIPEASQLTMQAGAMGAGGEIFVLDMGEPVKIVDLARDMIRLSGFSERDIKIEFTGLRPGEKLFEELLADNETSLSTPHPKLRIAKARTAGDGDWLQELKRWLAQPQVQDDAAVRDELVRWVPEYVAMQSVAVPARQLEEGAKVVEPMLGAKEVYDAK
jgi:FlaA1/EpsC-like NDP-sugar epimerase